MLRETRASERELSNIMGRSNRIWMKYTSTKCKVMHLRGHKNNLFCYLEMHQVEVA